MCSPFFRNWKQAKHAVKFSWRNGRTKDCLKMIKIFRRWRVKTIAVQHNLFSLCLLLNSAGIWKTNMWYNQEIFKGFLEYYWIFKHFREKQFLPHGRHAKTFDRFCRTTTAYLGRRHFSLSDRQKKRIQQFVGENGYSDIFLITSPLVQMWL